MKNFTKLFLALSLVATPVAFTSCDDDDIYSNYYYNDLVSEAVDNYFNAGGTSNYYEAYNFFYTYYPEAYNDEFNAFMNVVMNANVQPYWNNYYDVNYNWNNNYSNTNTSADQQLVAEAQMLAGEWSGTMVYEYEDEATSKRVRDRFNANMKFYQYGSSSDVLKGHGTEVDTRSTGESQTLDFTWYIADDGDIYIQYTKSGAVFVFDAQSSTEGFHLGKENNNNYDTFFGTASSKNTTDVLSIDLKRIGTSAYSRTRATGADKQHTKFGKSTRGVLATFVKGAVNNLPKR